MVTTKEKILVIDDEPSIRKYLRTLLEVDGFEVETVPSGQEGLARVSEGAKPDFVILDVLMPEMDGLETLRQLMQVDRSLNVIMLSCSNEVGTTVVEAIRLGALDYMTKPFEKPELDAALLKCRQKKELRHRESGAPGILRGCDGRYFLPCGKPANAQDSPADIADCAGGRSDFYQRRERSGKRSGGAHDPSSFHAQAAAFREGELRRSAGRVARNRASLVMSRELSPEPYAPSQESSRWPIKARFSSTKSRK